MDTGEFLTKKASKNSQLSRDAWLHQALEVLRTEGIQGVRIERLARDLNVTKGSFYWHFQDRDDLLQSMLDFWYDQYTKNIVENRSYLEDDPARGLLAALSKVREEGLDKYELAMRAWADLDPQVHKAVRAVYKKRIKFVCSFYDKLGFEGIDAEVRTRLTLCYMSWEPNMYPQDSKAHRLALLKHQLDLLTKK